MDGLFWLNVVMRWLHVASAVAALGAAMTLRLAIMPALAPLEQCAEAMGAIRDRLKKLIHASLGLLLLTGFYNYIVVTIPAVRAKREGGAAGFEIYHPLMGLKILLSFAIFAIAIVLLSSREIAPQSRRGMLSVNVALGILVLLIGAYLRRLWAL